MTGVEGLTLAGAGADATTIDGGFRLTSGADDATIRGFAIENGLGTPDHGITIENGIEGTITIESSEISAVKRGIATAPDVNAEVNVADNVITDVTTGVSSEGNQLEMTISENTISDSDVAVGGVRIDDGNLTVQRNTIANNDAGVDVAFANNVDISNNDFIGDDQTATFVEDFGPAVEQGEQLDLDAILNNQGNTFAWSMVPRLSLKSR